METFLAKDQKSFVEGDEVRFSHFFLTKECFACEE